MEASPPAKPAAEGPWLFTVALAVLSSRLLQAACPGLTLPVSWGLHCGVTHYTSQLPFPLLWHRSGKMDPRGWLRHTTLSYPTARERPLHPPKAPPKGPGPVIPAGERAGR